MNIKQLEKYEAAQAAVQIANDVLESAERISVWRGAALKDILTRRAADVLARALELSHELVSEEK